MKISIITWDANFREKLHTIDAFANQDFDHSKYEFIWVDFYNSNDAVREKLEQFNNFKLLALCHSDKDSWHLGKCINEGVKASSGDVLVIPDGDILVDTNYLNQIYESHQHHDDLLLYSRRYDESEAGDLSDSDFDLDEVKSRTKLINPLNYAGCFSLRRSLFQVLGGYEEHNVFSGPGMNAYEFYIRARNLGASIKWHRENVYHPWHPSTGASNSEDNERSLLKVAKEYYPWISPYSGLHQSWVVHCREMNLDTIADSSAVDNYLSDIPNIKLDRFALNNDLVRQNNILKNENEKLGVKLAAVEKKLGAIEKLWFVRIFIKLLNFIK